MKNINFDSELEMSWEIPVTDLINLFRRKILHKERTLYIEQKWCAKTVVAGVPVSTRIRKTEPRGAVRAEDIQYEYTVKYYFSKTKRMEVNSPLTQAEYQTLFLLYTHGKVVNKTRILFVYDWLGYGNPKSIIYSADIIPGEPKAIIEVEFASEEQKNNYVLPDWLKPYRRENDNS